jgi:hypothetical protein
MGNVQNCNSYISMLCFPMEFIHIFKYNYATYIASSFNVILKLVYLKKCNYA